MQIDKKYQSLLDDLINFLKNMKFLTDNNVESAFRNIPRHEFILSSELDRAYYNEPLPIMKHQTISQPGVVSRMSEWLDVKDGQNILEIGTGSGWQTAIPVPTKQERIAVCQPEPVPISRIFCPSLTSSHSLILDTTPG